MRGLSFTEKGKGDVSIVFLHFFGGSSNTWSELTDRLSSDYRCIAVDVNGFGRSRVANSGTTLHDQTGLVLELIKELQLENFVLIGHSMGGKIALSVASNQPAGLLSLVLVAPSPPTPEPIEEAKRSSLKNDFGNRSAIEELVRKLTVEPLAGSSFDEVVNDHLVISREAWNSWLDEGSRQDISGDMDKISVPVLIVSGSEDANLPVDFLKKEFESFLPDAEFVEVPNAGHLLPLEQPAVLSELISSFVAVLR